jgi:hypothetical protein
LRGTQPPERGEPEGNLYPFQVYRRRVFQSKTFWVQRHAVDPQIRAARLNTPGPVLEQTYKATDSRSKTGGWALQTHRQGGRFPSILLSNLKVEGDGVGLEGKVESLPLQLPLNGHTHAKGRPNVQHKASTVPKMQGLSNCCEPAPKLHGVPCSTTVHD